MKNFFNFLILAVLSASMFSSCDKDNEDLFPSELIKGGYVVNYGVYGAGGASISKFDYSSNGVTNNYFSNQNNGLELVSNIQYAYKYNDSIYLLGNSKDQLITVDPLFRQTVNGITENIQNPRYCIANGDYLYISCWGDSVDWTTLSDAYIAKFNIKTNKVDKMIALPGGPEGLAVANGKLYAALNYVDSIGVINLSSDVVSYIATPAVSSYFVTDDSNNLYVSLVSTYTDYSTQTGLGYINTNTDKLEQVYLLDGVSSDYGSIISTNSDQSKIYLVTAQYDANWKLSGGISAFDVATKTFSTFISGISGPKGISVNPADDKVYLFSAESLTEGGLMKIYLPNGSLEKEFTTGISPYMALFQE